MDARIVSALIISVTAIGLFVGDRISRALMFAANNKKLKKYYDCLDRMVAELKEDGTSKGEKDE